MPKKILILLVLAAIFTACAPAQPDPAVIQAQVNTAVVGTMQANQRIEQAVQQTVAAQQPTSTLEPAPTDAVVFLKATDTPIVVPTFTLTKVPPALRYTCTAITLKPKSNEAFPGGIAIDIKWRVTNTGTAPWYDGVDMKYVGGAYFADFKRVEIGKVVQPGESVIVEVDATTPTKGGSYFMSWLVDGPMCYGYVTIKVK